MVAGDCVPAEVKLQGSVGGEEKAGLGSFGAGASMTFSSSRERDREREKEGERESWCMTLRNRRLDGAGERNVVLPLLLLPRNLLHILLVRNPLLLLLRQILDNLLILLLRNPLRFLLLLLQ